MTIVCDTSPLLLFARADRLGLLPALYQRVVVPGAVLQEVNGVKLLANGLCKYPFRKANGFGFADRASRSVDRMGFRWPVGVHFDGSKMDEKGLAGQKMA